MTIRQPIEPSYGSGVISVLGAAGTATVDLPKTRQVIITNQGANPVYVRVGSVMFGASVPAATTADYPVPPNAQVVITRGSDNTRVNLLSPAGTTVHVMGGEGW